MKTTLEFKCPICGGKKYLDGGNLRLCDSQVFTGDKCTFAWPAQDDWQYFRAVVSFETRFQFSAYMFVNKIVQANRT